MGNSAARGGRQRRSGAGSAEVASSRAFRPDACGKFALSVRPGAVLPCACRSFASLSNIGLSCAPTSARDNDPQ